MAKQTIKKTTTTIKKTTIKLKPKSREELSQLRSQQAKTQKRAANGRFA